MNGRTASHKARPPAISSASPTMSAMKPLAVVAGRSTWTLPPGRRYDIYDEPWTIDFPAAEQNLSRRVRTVTSIQVNEPVVLTLEDPGLWNYPWIYIVEPGNLRLKPSTSSGSSVHSPPLTISTCALSAGASSAFSARTAQANQPPSRCSQACWPSPLARLACWGAMCRPSRWKSNAGSALSPKTSISSSV